MAHRLTRRSRRCSSGGLHPQYRDVVQTLSRPVGGDPSRPCRPIRMVSRTSLPRSTMRRLAWWCSFPDVFGRVRDLTPIAAAAHEKGALLIAVVTEIVSLGALKPPGEMGADIVVAEGQSIGVGLNFGGPVCRTVRDAAEIHPPDAGPRVRRDRRCNGKRGFRADAVDPRAAYSPREGDQQYLHEFRTLRCWRSRSICRCSAKGLNAACPSITRMPRPWRTH